jgi:hypothetical protein
MPNQPGGGPPSIVSAFIPAHLPESHIKERMSSAYISAVAARAGCTCTPTAGGEDYGVDFYLQKVGLVNNVYEPISSPVTLQSKATVTSIIVDDAVSYSIKGKAYNKIVRANASGIPTALVLFRLPLSYHDWLLQDQDVLRLHHCAYWSFIEGDIISDASAKAIKIPVTQMFGLDSIDALFSHAKRIRKNEP